MKRKQVLAFLLAAAMTVGSVPAFGLNDLVAYAAEETSGNEAGTEETTDGFAALASSCLTGSADSWSVNGENSGKQGQVAQAVDGDSTTYWHSNYGTETDTNHKAVYDGSKLTGYNNYYIKLDKAYTVSAVTYVPRTDASTGLITGNGAITKCNVYVSTDGGNTWSDPVSSGDDLWTYTDTNVTRTVTLPTPVEGVTNIKIEAINTTATSSTGLINAAEFGVIAKAASSTTETTGTENGSDAILSETKQLTIKMGAAESQELSGESSGKNGWAIYAVDGDTNTHWHSGYSNRGDSVAPTISSEGSGNAYYIALDEASTVAQVNYLPRQTSGDVNGTLLKCDVYVTTDALENMPSISSVTDADTANSVNTSALAIFNSANWVKVETSSFTSGSWTYDSVERLLRFTEAKEGVTGIKIVATETGAPAASNYNKFISAGEFTVYGPQGALYNYVTSKAQTIGYANGTDGNRTYTKDSWNTYYAALMDANDSSVNKTLSSAEYIAKQTTLEEAVAGLKLAASNCECTLSDVTGFSNQSLVVSGGKLEITLGEGAYKVNYTTTNDCMKHKNETAAITYTLSDNTAGATVNGSKLTVTQAGSVTVTATVKFGDYTKTATATYTVTEVAASEEQKAELSAAVADVKNNYEADADKYTADSWKALSDAVAAANAIGADAKESEVTKAKDAIATAISNLVPASRSSLDELKNEISGLNEADYTADSWKNLQDAVAAADALPSDAGLAATDKAYSDLVAAKAALTVKTAETDTQNPTTSTDQTNSTNPTNPSNPTNPTTTATPAKKGEIKDDGIYSYRILDPDAKTVEVTGLKKTSLTKLTIFSTVTLDGVTYKVTGVAAKAFKGNKKITAVTIKKGVTSIGKNAFAGCAKLKKITIKSTTLKTVGKKAFKGINKKATIKVPKAKRAAYKKLLAKKGQASSVKIK